MAKEDDKDYTISKDADGRKVRRVKEAVPATPPKPNKMKAVRPRRVQASTTSMSNSALLVFPTDKLGITSKVKTALIQSASKIGSDKEALKLLKTTVEMLMQHVQARHEEALNYKPLNQKVDTSTPEVEDGAQGSFMDELEASYTDMKKALKEASYTDMKKALKEADVKPASFKAVDVQKAYDKLKGE